MENRVVILLGLLVILVSAFLVVPGTAAGLTVTDDAIITTPTGATSPVITITDADIIAGDTITIDASSLAWAFVSETFTDANVVINDTAANATWTKTLAGNILTLTSTGGVTSVGENITVTFIGTPGNPWRAYTGGPVPTSLSAIRTDGMGEGYFNVVIDTVPPPSAGLSITNGEPIIVTTGATSPVFNVTDSDIAPEGTITIFVPFLSSIVASGSFNNKNILISDTAAEANWTGTVTNGKVILTSSGGATHIGETVTVTFTGKTNPWVVGILSGSEYPFITAVRSDGLGAGYFSITIGTQDPTDLGIAEGAKITTRDGVTSKVITITGTEIVPEGTIIIDVLELNAYVTSRNFSDANIKISDTAANATWTAAIADYFLTLTSAGGPTIAGENITLTFTGAINPWIGDTDGEKSVPLTAARTDGAGSGTINFVIETVPPANFNVVADFSASPATDVAPLTTTFTDTSQGGPTSWKWDFGDGSTSTIHNPTHTYANIGVYSVSLTAANTYGSDTKTRLNYINVLNGALWEANTAMPGLNVDIVRDRQVVTVDTSVLPAVLSSTNTMLDIQPPADRGLKNITIIGSFSRNGNLISGYPKSVHLVSEDIRPSSGFSSYIGTEASFNYSIDLSSYPRNARISTKILEGVTTEDDYKLLWVASNNSAFPIGTAYTAKITRTNFPDNVAAKVHMSVDSGWNPSLTGGPGNVFIWRIDDDGNSGQILPTTYLSTDPANNLDYYEADSPSGLSTFGLSSLTGSNNPFQLIAFVAAQTVNQPSSPSSSAGGGTAVAVQATTAPETTKTTPMDAGKTAKIYSNDEGTVTQAMTLESTDGLANVSLGLGIVARESTGKPLTSISITRVPDLPAAPTDGALSFAGIAYELKPDGATFSPAIPLSFTIPQSQWGKEYVIQAYDHAAGTWVDHPSVYDPQTGTITAQVSHLCCFALFAKSAEPVPAETAEPAVTPQPTILVSSKSAMSTNLEMYGWILSMIVDNPVTLVIMVAALALVAYFGWWKRRL